MNYIAFQGGFDKNLSYLIWCDKTKIAAIVDPAVNSASIIATIEKNGLILQKILITHSHYDHTSFIEDYIYYLPEIEVCCNKQSTKLFQSNNIKGICNNEVIMLGEALLISLYTPGHYHDSICFWVKNSNLLFTGDTMFVGRSGRTISTTSNIKEQFNSIYSIILSLPLNTTILPGHHYGYKQSISLDENIQISKFFQCKNFKEFQLVMRKFERTFKK